MLLDVRADHLKIVQEILRKFVPEHEVWAFGSRAKWLAKEYSDLDLCIVGDSALSFRTLGLLEEAFEDSDLPYKVDVVDWATTSESFRKIIERDRVMVKKTERSVPKTTNVEWFEKSLGEVTINHDGKRRPVKESDRKKGPYPYYGASGIVDYVDGYIFEGRHLLVAEDGENLRTRQTPIAFMADGKFWVNNHAHIVTGNGELTTEYLNYFLQNADIQSYLTGAVMPKLTQGNLNRIPVRYPDSDYQNAIVRVLAAFDDKININSRINQTLEAMAQAIFKSWFVDFDLVKAKIAAKQEGRNPLSAAMSTICGKSDTELDALPCEQYEQLAATAALFPDELEESELGVIPRGWSVRAMPECIDVNPSRLLKKGAVAQYLDMANVPTNSARAQKVVSREFTSGSKFKNGDTLLARITPCLENGKTAFVDFLNGDEVGWGSTEFIVLRPKNGLPEPFAYFLCRDPDFRAFAIAQMAGTSGRQRVPNDCFGGYKLVQPAGLIAIEFGRLAGAALNQIKALDEEAKTLANLRDTLLPKLLSGELSIEEARNKVAP
jgi:type I restriction enzyme, S subunit